MSGPGLVAYDSCDSALAGLRAAAAAQVGPDGFPQDSEYAEEGPNWTPRGWSSGPLWSDEPAASVTRPDQDTDEPDLTKTDGRRIVTLTKGVLRVFDPAGRRETGRLDFGERRGQTHLHGSELVLRGDRALVLSSWNADGRRTEGDPLSTSGLPLGGTAQVTLVDLSGPPRVLGVHRLQGSLVDSRLTGDTARVVVRTRARFGPGSGDGSDESRRETVRKTVEQADIDHWLPRFEWHDGDEWHRGRVDCDRLSGTDRATGAATVTVLSFDLTRDRLGDGDPVSIAANAHLVHATGTDLYLADVRYQPKDRQTDVYQFDVDGPGRPRFLASGTVPGWPESPHALSDRQGHLLVTTGATTGDTSAAESTVRVLRRADTAMVETGAVSGIGRSREPGLLHYAEDRAYLVTRTGRYRKQDEQVHVVDLSDPGRPRLLGDASIAGHGGYVQSLPGGRLLVAGQEEASRGRFKGPQLALLDLGEPGHPDRSAQWRIPDLTEDHFDGTVVLHEPETGLTALPVGQGLRLLRLSGDAITELGTVAHPDDDGKSGRFSETLVLRAMLVDGVLWTVSFTGAQASDPATGKRLAWLPST
ncbi:beta-propeller domain-containing protein [Micromonospora sp. NPDC002389]|uniref:beta-propeller domain-containing protein n=1 Tax=Micromonospora sp. NPDC002389 TaxID=3154272 RepID=UPI00332EB107